MSIESCVVCDEYRILCCLASIEIFVLSVTSIEFYVVCDEYRNLCIVCGEYRALVLSVTSIESCVVWQV